MKFAKIWPDEMNATNEHPGNGFIPVTDDPNAPVPGTGDPNASVQDPAFVSVTSAGAEGHSDQEAVEEGSGDEGGAKGEGKKVTSLCVFLLCLFLKLCDVISGLYVVRWLCGVLDM